MNLRRPTTGVWRCEFDDVDEQAACVGEMYAQRYEQLAAGRFHGEFMQLHLDGVCILRERIDRLLIQAGKCPEFMIGWLGAVTGRYRCDGTDVRPEHILMYEANGEFEMIADASEVFAISIAPELFEDWIGSRCTEGAPRSLRGVRMVPPERLAMLRHLVDRVIYLADRGDGLADHLQRDGLRDELLNAASAAALGTIVDERPSRRCEGTFERVVSAAREIAGDLTESLTIDEICRRVGVSRRNLYYAFHGMLGVSPGYYLQSVRLNAARRAIKRHVRAGRTIAEIVSGLGFTHPSHFTAEYKRRFGELPSQTAQRRADNRLT